MRDKLGFAGVAESKTFETFDPMTQRVPEERATVIAAVKVACSFLEKPRTIVFSGPNGVGKTHLAYAIGNALLEKHGMAPVVMFASFQQMLLTLRTTYRDGHDGFGEEWYFDRWTKIPLLIVDDVGAEGLEEKPSEFTRKVGLAIVDGRYRAGNRPIVMTTNKDPETLALWITPSAVSRLYEMGEFVLMRGRDWRLPR